MSLAMGSTSNDTTLEVSFEYHLYRLYISMVCFIFSLRIYLAYLVSIWLADVDILFLHWIC